MFEHIAAIAAGYVFALLVGHWAISALMRSAGSFGSAARGGAAHPAAIGFLERTLYLGAWQLGAKGFIGLWLALKVIGNWKRWAAETSAAPETHRGRGTFNLFLLGAGTSVGFAVAGALMTEMLDHNDWAQALLLGAAVVGATLGLAWFLGRARE